MTRTKVLIVEDESIVALGLKKDVEKLKCEITDIVYNQKQVLVSICENKPDLILMDIKLGDDEDGIEITKEIQKSKNIPILYISAFSDDKTMQRVFSTKPIGFIVKPYKYEDLKTNLQLAMYKLNLNVPLNINKEHHYLGEGFYFDKKEKGLYFKDNLIRLGLKEKQLLSILIDANYCKVQFDYLEDIIWDGYRPSKSSLRTLIYRLKGKLGNDIIQVAYGSGYYLKRP